MAARSATSAALFPPRAMASGKMSVTEAAQAVQRSAHPHHYAKWEPAARRWLDELG
jgi:hypothetical protein